MPVNEPYVSIVATSRNDNHGESLHRRMQTFVSALINQCKRHDLHAELILVEWNPPTDRPKLAEALQWPEDPSPCEIRIVEVPPELHAKYDHAETLPLFQMIGKNVGIRRARGQFVLATNIDIILNDELMAFLKSGKLEKGKNYRIDRTDVETFVPADAPVEEQLAYCDSHIIRVNGQDGTYRVDRQGRLLPEANDVVAVGGPIYLEHWHHLERFEGNPFRWATENPSLLLERKPESEILELEIAPGPGCGWRSFDLNIQSDTAGSLGNVHVSSRCRILVPLAAGAPSLERIQLQVSGGGKNIPNDSRVLNFSLHRAMLRAESAASPKQISVETFGQIGPADVAPIDSWVRLGDKFHGLEHDESIPYRWAQSGAEIVLVAGQRPSQSLRFDVELGPGVTSRTSTFSVRDSNGRILVEKNVSRGRHRVVLAIPELTRDEFRLQLHVEGGGALHGRDSRVLDFRIFWCDWLGSKAKAPRKPSRWNRWLNRLLGGKSQANVAPPAAPAKSVDRFEPTADACIVGEPQLSPIAMHTNACGDFTMMARDHWFDLRGYPEFEMYSLHIDSAIMFMAHYAGVEQVILPEPMRAFHIEHSAGSGWTPEGENKLFERLAAKGIPVLSWMRLLSWASDMRRLKCPFIFNRENWGIGDRELPETRIGRPATVRRAA